MHFIVGIRFSLFLNFTRLNIFCDRFSCVFNFSNSISNLKYSCPETYKNVWRFKCFALNSTNLQVIPQKRSNGKSSNTLIATHSRHLLYTIISVPTLLFLHKINNGHRKSTEDELLKTFRMQQPFNFSNP